MGNGGEGEAWKKGGDTRDNTEYVEVPGVLVRGDLNLKGGEYNLGLVLAARHIRDAEMLNIKRASTESARATQDDVRLGRMAFEFIQ